MTVPMFVAAGVPRGGGGAVSMPSGVLAGDVLLLAIETYEAYGTAPSGWELVADSPQAATGTNLTVFWKRATKGEGTVTVVSPGNHIYSVVTAYRGCRPSGDPWHVTSGGTDSTSDTDVDIGGDTTTVADCLVVAICASSLGTSSPWASGWTNSDITFTERTDDGTTSGNGGGVAVATGPKATAGTYGTTAVTLTGAATKAFMTIALAPSEAPWVKRLGTVTGNMLGITVVWPTHESGDVGLLFVETANQPVSAPSGWVEVDDSPQGTGTAGTTGGTMIQVFWKRATSSSETNPAVADAGDHQFGGIITFSNVVASGDPWDVTAGSVKASASTDVSVAGTDTTLDYTLVVVAATTTYGILSTAEFSAWANANLASIGEYFDNFWEGPHGGIATAAGALLAAGAIGTTTATTVNSGANAYHVTALRPAQITLTPAPVAVVLAATGPTFSTDQTLTPDAVAATLTVPVPAISGVSDLLITPDPVTTALAVTVPTWDWVIVLEPDPVAAPLAVPVPVVFQGWSELYQPFYLGSVYADLSQPWALIGPVVAARLDQWFDLAGSLGASLSQPFALEGAVGATLHELFDLLGVSGYVPPSWPPVWLPLMVFDKAGSYLGSIVDFNVTGAPTRYLRSMRVTNEGGMTFNVPRQSPDIDLIASDRLVRLQSTRYETPWIGTMSPQASAGGIVEVECRDAYTLLRDGLAITLEEEVSDGTPAVGVFTRIMGIHNDLRAGAGEVAWELDLQGSRPFRGDLSLDGDTLSCLDAIMGRSRTELAWDSRLDGNRLVPILRVRDAFAGGAGAAIYDGTNGNVVAGVQVVEDPTPLVFSIRLTGATTDLAKCLPEWAQWALKDVTPEVTVSVDPGPYRMRQRLDDSLDWGLSKAAVAAQCNAIVAWIWELYRSFIMAVHDIEGRPWHDGWMYLGPPEAFGPKVGQKDSLSRRAWKTRLQLVEVLPNEPASAVMISDKYCTLDLREWLIVKYNRVTGVQTVMVVAIPSAVGLHLIQWSITGSITLYKVSGKRITWRAPRTGGSGYVDPYSVRIWDPVAGRYRNLRRIISGTLALAYYIDPADKDNKLTDLGPDAAIDQVAGDGSSLIGKMYDFEEDAIDDYDPRSNGIGVLKTWATVFNGTVTNRPRWHISSFNVGGDATTSLTTGISATDTDFEVDSILGFPDPDTDADEFPFLIQIDDGSNAEIVLVISMVGSLWHVARGQQGTTAIIHETGATVKRSGVDGWDGFPFPYTWPEGEQWAAEELAELSKPRIDLDIHVSHFRGDQLTFAYGTTHAVDVDTEGPTGRWAGIGRAIGWSTGDGETEIVLEWQT